MIDERRMTAAEIGDDLAHIEDALHSVATARAEIGDVLDARELAKAAVLLALDDRVSNLIGLCVEQSNTLRRLKTDILLANDDGLRIRYSDAIDRANAVCATLKSLRKRWLHRIALAREVVAGRA